MRPPTPAGMAALPRNVSEQLGVLRQRVELLSWAQRQVLWYACSRVTAVELRALNAEQRETLVYELASLLELVGGVA